MKRIALTIVAVCLTPLLSGCCCCGSPMQCGSSGGYSSYGGDYGSCLSYEESYAGGGQKCHCKGGTDFSLPPAGSSYPIQSGLPYGTTYGPEIVGPEIVGPEVYGPEYVPNDAQWQQVAPDSAPSVTPAVPGAAPSGPTPLLPPSPIPQISNGSVVVPPPAPPASPASNSAETTGPMMPPVPPPPPEPISQMRFRQYR